MFSVPRPPSLPDSRTPLRFDGQELETATFRLRTVTPILGGAHRTREIDTVDFVRVPAIRGALRMWWRALFGGEYDEVRALYEREVQVWGGLLSGETRGAAPAQKVKRSPVQITIAVHNAKMVEVDRESPAMSARDGYALWPAREERNHGQLKRPAAPRRLPGLEFTLTMQFPAAEAVRREVLGAVRAWILFGGYGGRTRRGVGSLTLLEAHTERESDRWLPKEATRDEIVKVFGWNPFESSSSRGCDDLPLLAGAELVSGQPKKDAQQVWFEALGWLQEFRQGRARSEVKRFPSNAARDRGSKVPGKSFWPEPDKIRHIFGGSWKKEARHNATPVWPRAGFGLPIVGKVKGPGDFKLHWFDRKDHGHERLASPLIVKAMPLDGGRFVPIGIWLHRAYPDGTVGLSADHWRSDRSRASFDQLVAEGDTALYAPLVTKAVRNAQAGHKLQRAFMDWVTQKNRVRRIF